VGNTEPRRYEVIEKEIILLQTELRKIREKCEHTNLSRKVFRQWGTGWEQYSCIDCGREWPARTELKD
jgi:transposase-like protein